MMQPIVGLGLSLSLFAGLPIAAPGGNSEWPLTLQLVSSEVTDLSGGNLEATRQADQMGAASPIMILFHGALNGETHWFFECERENSHGETNACTEIPQGKYPARWMHNRQMLEVLVDSSTVRYLDVSTDPSAPPTEGDLAYGTASFDFPVVKPADKLTTDYPLLIHVYGSSRMKISKGYVLLDAKVDGRNAGMVFCDAKTRLGMCAPLSPGFFPGRWLDARKSKIVLLATSGGDTREFGFAVQ